MGWGITIKDVFVTRATIDRLDSEIEELEETIRFTEREITMLVAASPKTFNEEDETWFEKLPFKLTEILDNYKSDIERLQLLRLAKENEITEG